MNKRIDKLIKQSTQELTGFDYRFGNTTTTYFNKEKFAELIVREAVRILDEQEEYFSSALIMKHFGVRYEQ